MILRLRSRAILIAILSALPSAPLVADIRNWRTGEVIPGTEGIVPGPGIYLGDRNTVEQNLRFADFSGGLDLSDADFRRTWLEDARFVGANLTGAFFRSAELTNVDLSDALVNHANLVLATRHGFTREQLYSTASYRTRNLTGIQLASNDLAGWNFAQQNLADANFTFARMAGAGLSDAQLDGADFEQANLIDADLGNASGGGANFRYAKLSNANLSGAQFPGGNFDWAELNGSKLSGANLAGAYFGSTSSLAGANLRQANLTGARLSGILVDADLTYAVVHGTEFWFATERGFTKEQLYSTASYKAKDLVGTSWHVNDMSGWNFAGQNLAGAGFLSAKLVDTDLTDANLAHANLGFADLTRARLSRANLDGADFNGANLSEADLSHTRLAGSNLTNLVLSGADLTDTNLVRANLSYTNMAGATLLRANLDEAQLSYANLTEANLSHIRLVRSDLAHADLSGANLTDANLIGAYLRNSVLTNANLSGANIKNATLEAQFFSSAILSEETVYNQWTVFPNNFDPVGAGLTYMASPVGDFDANDILDVVDVDLLSAAIRRERTLRLPKSMFQLNGDRDVDRADLRVWIEDRKRTSFGDADLDGVVAFSDFLSLSNSFGQIGGWGQGDFDASGFVSFADYLLLAENFGEVGTRGVAVPEPTSGVLWGLVSWLFYCRRALNRRLELVPFSM